MLGSLKFQPPSDLDFWTQPQVWMMPFACQFGTGRNKLWDHPVCLDVPVSFVMVIHAREGVSGVFCQPLSVEWRGTNETSLQCIRTTPRKIYARVTHDRVCPNTKRPRTPNAPELQLPVVDVNQKHRVHAVIPESGLPIPTGRTRGSLRIAVERVRQATVPNQFRGVLTDG